jgi:flavin-dependent dehydrogenase
MRPRAGLIMEDVMLSGRAEVAVVGGGLAGAVVAMRLARLGFRVAALEPAAVRPDFPRSTPLATLPVLEQLGLSPDRVSSLLTPISESSVNWAGTRVVPPHPSVLVDVAGFVGALQAAARAAGVRQFSTSATPALVREPAGHWSIAAGRARIEADVLIVSGPAQLASERRLCGAPTAAWVTSWQGPPEASVGVTVEASANGWAWLVNTRSGRRFLSVVQEPAPDEGNAAAWQRLGTEFGHGRVQLPSEAQQLARLDASSYRFAPAIGEALLRVGSACFTLDPLSSQGMIASITNALQAAAVTNTLLRHPAHAAHAVAFYGKRVDEVCASGARHAGAFYAEGAAHFHTPFWQRRASSPPEPRLGVRSNRVPDGRLQLSTAAQLVLEPVLDGDRIVPQPALRGPALDRPVAYLSRMPVAQALQQALCGAAPRPVLEWLWAHHILEQGHDAGGRTAVAPAELRRVPSAPTRSGPSAHGSGPIESQRVQERS